MTLGKLKPGNRGTTKKLSIKDKLCQPLMDMGIYPGFTLKVFPIAPLEDSMESKYETVRQAIA